MLVNCAKGSLQHMGHVTHVGEIAGHATFAHVGWLYSLVYIFLLKIVENTGVHKTTKNICKLTKMYENYEKYIFKLAFPIGLVRWPVEKVPF